SRAAAYDPAAAVRGGTQPGAGDGRRPLDLVRGRDALGLRGARTRVRRGEAGGDPGPVPLHPGAGRTDGDPLAHPGRLRAGVRPPRRHPPAAEGPHLLTAALTSEALPASNPSAAPAPELASGTVFSSSRRDQ